METRKQPTAGPPLEAAARVEGTILLLDYVFRNTRSKPVYLFNVLWEFGPKGKSVVAAPQPAYVCWKDGTVHVAKQIPPLPRTRSVELRRVSFATKVEAGQEFREALRLPLPLAEYNPYFPAKPESKYEARKATALKFSLQLLNHSEDVKVEPAPLPEALIVQHPDLFGQVETLSAKPLPVTVTVNKRLDAFEDF